MSSKNVAIGFNVAGSAFYVMAFVAWGFAKAKKGEEDEKRHKFIWNKVASLAAMVCILISSIYAVKHKDKDSKKLSDSDKIGNAIVLVSLFGAVVAWYREDGNWFYQSAFMIIAILASAQLAQ